MKRTVLLIAPLALILLVAAMAAAQTPPSVPNLINFQGRLTDNVGNPVADGAHSVHFYIFPVRTGGVSLWDELQNPTTTGGLFTTQLGSVNTLPLTLFQDYDSLFLEIVADAQLISPRTLLSASPLTRTADGLNGQSPFNPARSYIRTFPFNHQLSTFGADGQEQIRLWGPSWGEMYLFDSSPSNFLNFWASGEGFPGGFLWLGDGAGSFPLALNGGVAGDASAILPTDAIDAGEILDEPGIAHEFQAISAIAIPAVATSIDTVTITAPTGGFIIVMAHFQLDLVHSNGTNDDILVSINTTAGVQDLDNAGISRINSALPTFTGSFGITELSCTKVEAVSAGPHTYFLNANYAGTAGALITRRHLTAMFFPTNYGTVVSTKPAISDVGGALRPSINADASGSNVSSTVQVTTVADHQAQLDAERAKQIADLEARIKALEAKQTAVQQPGTVRPR